MSGPRRRMGDVVVLLPGIGGSVLQQDGRDVWAASAGGLWRALRTLGGSIKGLALEGDPPDAADLGDGVRATRLFDDVHILPGIWKIDGYSGIRRRLLGAFDLEPGRNYFEFAYDWRRDCRVAAARLSAESRGWLRQWQEDSGNGDARLVLIGHSMGGLVARHFLERLDGWRDTRMLITFGTPYKGSLGALDFLTNGMRKQLGPVTVADLSELLRSFTSVYQLLPIYPCVAGADAQMRRVTEAGPLPNLDPDRVRAAFGFHHDIAAAVEEHHSDDAYRRGGYRLHPVVGTFQPTFLSARLDAAGAVEVLDHYPGEPEQDGDGTVPAVSGVPRELANQGREVFAADRHASLQNADSVFVQVHGLLSGLSVDQSRYFAVDVTHLSVAVGDAYAAGEPVRLTIGADTEGVTVTVSVVDAATGRPAHTAQVSVSDEPVVVDAGPLAPGTYRVTVSGEGRVDPVTDVFVVAGGDGG